MLAMAMASGAEYISGTFTAPAYGEYVLDFGKTFQKYFYYFEMTDDSKDKLMGTNINSYRAYCLYGTYPAPNIDGYAPSNQFTAYRINPSSKAVSQSKNAPQACSESSITMPNYAVTGSSTMSLYAGYTYKYTVISLDNLI